MNQVNIQKLTPDMAEQYVAYFDNRAFSDGNEQKGCYCVWHHWTEQKEDERSAMPEAERPFCKRNYAYELVKNGKLNGFIAVSDGEIVGFCNADLKENYFRHSRDNDPESWDGIELDSKVLTIVCYIVAPDMRGMGIADSLLEYACHYAEDNGFDYIEGYPSDGTFDVRNCGGTDSMYIKRGFQIIKTGDRIIARKRIGESD